MKRSAWMAIVLGWLVQLGLKTLLPIAVLVGVRYWSEVTANPSLWMEHPDDSGHPVWYVLQASIFIGSMAAGGLAALLAPRRAMMVPIALVILSLLSTGFEQFPRPLSLPVAWIWVGGPCAGLLIGVWLTRRLMRGQA